MRERMETGTVKWFKDSRGFGFIVPDRPRPDGRDVFTHYSGINMEGHRTLRQGQRVRFEVGLSPDRRPMALNVTVITEEVGSSPESLLASG
jgi:CspA family cold shock protein